jgi:hypothetical protein
VLTECREREREIQNYQTITRNWGRHLKRQLNDGAGTDQQVAKLDEQIVSIDSKGF